MNKSVITSVSPRECELIASGQQTMLVRKTRPKIETPFKCYIYKSFGKRKDCFAREIQTYFNCGKVIGEFVCDKIEKIEFQAQCSSTLSERWTFNRIAKQACLTAVDMSAYLNGDNGYGWHITAPTLFDKPRELGEFRKPCNHINDCCTCKEAEFQYDGDELRGLICKREISLTRPPQSWVYCEPIEEE